MVVTVGSAPVLRVSAAAVPYGPAALTVAGTTNLYGAGHSAAPGGGTLPLPYPVAGGKVDAVTITATGTVDPGNSLGVNGPDGNAGYFTDAAAVSGLSPITATKAMFLAGVFVGPTEPVVPNPPAYAGGPVAPAIGQLFIVGKGGTFRIPTAATRLFLGFVDQGWQGNICCAPAFAAASAPACCYADNTGSLSVWIRNSMPKDQSKGAPAPGTVKKTNAKVSDPVNTATGAFTHETLDLTLTGRGVAFALVRSYDSSVTDVLAMGPGWGHTYAGSVVRNTTTGELTWANGTGNKIVFAPNGGGFTAPPGVLAQASTVSGGWQVVTQDQSTHRFNAAGRLISILDRSGQGVTLAYDASNRVSTVTDASLRIATFTYGTVGAAAGLLTQVQTSDFRTVQYGYALLAGKNRLQTFTNERGQITTYAYDANGFVGTETDPLAHVQVTNLYDATGRVTDQADPLGKHTLFVWDDVAQTVTITDPTLAVHVHQYGGYVLDGMADPNGTTAIGYNSALDTVSVTDASGRLSTATYDLVGNMLSRTTQATTPVTESWTYDTRNNPLTYTDARGNTTAYTYDASGRIATETKPSPAPGVVAKTTWTWNSNGTLASLNDPNGNTTTYAYNSNGYLLSSIDPTGAKTSSTYDTAGRVLSTTEPRGNVAGLTPAQIATFTTTNTFDAAGNLLTTSDGSGHLTTNIYNSAGFLTQSTGPDGGIAAFTYNNANETLTITAPDGGLTTNSYDDRGALVQQIVPDGGVTKWTYDGAGRTLTKIEPRGNVSGANPALFTWTYGYDGVGRQTSVTDPAGLITTTAYDQVGRVASVADPRATTTYTYDANANVLTAVRAANGTTISTVSTTYDTLNRPVTSTDARGKIATLGYDPNGNQTSIVTSLGNRTTFTYDAVGRKKTMVDPRGNVSGGTPANYTWMYGYDLAGHQTTQQDPLGAVTTSTYDNLGNLASAKDARNNTTAYTYDTANRLATITAPASGVTTYTYDTVGQITSRKDAKNHITTYAYDLMHRVKKRTDPLGRFFTYSYDANGNAATVIDANANVPAVPNPALGSTTYTYDNLGRVTLTDYSNASDVTYTYDAKGRMASMIDGQGTETYGYDNASRLASISRGTNVFSYLYDAAGNVTSRTYPDGTITTYAYDDENRMSTATRGTQVTTYTYDEVANPTKTALPNGTSKSVTYDRAGRIATINHALGVVPIAGWTYTRDPNGNPTTITATGTNVAGSRVFAYDTANRLLSVCYSTITPCPAASATSWTYDLVGSRATQNDASVATTYTVDNADELTSSVTGGVTTNYTYDANGNQLTAGARTYAYNTAMQMTSSQEAGNTANAYAYDGSGNRAYYAYNSCPTCVVYTLWDKVGGLPQLALERNQFNGLMRRYSYGLEPISMSTPTTGTSYYLTDELGSVTHLTSATGAVQWAHTYTPFGSDKAATKVDPAAPANPLKFTGQYIDLDGTEVAHPSTGLYNLRARQYNPRLGTFTQVDPLQASVNQPYLSSYLYTNNQPTVLTDPSGLRGQQAKCNTSTGRHLGAFFTNINPFHEMSYCEAVTLASAVPAFDNATSFVYGTGDAITGPAKCLGSLSSFVACVKALPSAPRAFASSIAKCKNGDMRDCGQLYGTVLAAKVAAELKGALKPATNSVDEFGGASKYKDITKGGSIRNVETDVTRGSFESTLESNGWTKSVSKDGNASIFTKDGAKYSVRAKADSSPFPTADYTPAGSSKPTLKIRIGG